MGLAPTGLVQLSGRTVAGLYESRADAEQAAEALTFGDMQGFYVDSTDNYTVTGYYVQTSPDAIIADCGDPSDRTQCSPGAEIIASQAVEFTYQDIDAMGDVIASATSGTCGSVGLPPCLARRLSPLVDGPPFRLVKGRFFLVSAFRTLDGAEQFAELARDRRAEVAAIRVVKTGGPYVGLGQEANPDGVSGPLLAPLPDPERYQK